MNIGLIGSGGREHALCKKILESNKVKEIYCFPGNAGTSIIAKNIYIDILDFKKLLKFIKFFKIDIVIVGPEEPLVKGIVDFLRRNNIKVFGPNKNASKLEGSKSFVKKICSKYKIPSAKFQICKNQKDIYNFLKISKLPVVVKADGLAAGKGVTICRTKKLAIDCSRQIFAGKFESSKKVVIEEFLQGEEASYFLIVNNNDFKFFGTAQDHKKAFEKDKGPNTGGMGAYSPAPIINPLLEKKIISKIVKPTLQALKDKKISYSGFLYVGLMIKDNEPYLIEYNIRMGDPECQVILPRLKTDFIKIVENTITNKLKKTKIFWKNEKSMTIVLCSKGYPGKYKKDIAINNINKLNLSNHDYIFHAGTKFKNNQIVSNGGRVLNISSIGKNLLKVRNKILLIIKKLNWKHGFYRKDIGWKVIKKK